MPAGLSNLQKRAIAIAARKAYDAWPEREAFEAINSELSKSDCFNAWRHVEQGKATAAQRGETKDQGPETRDLGIQSLCEMTQAHYATVLAHFQALAGDGAAADRTRARDADNGRRIARYKLDEALRERGLTPGYVGAICRRQFRCELGDASAGQLWKLVYTVRNRRPAPSQTNGKTAAPAGAPNENPF